MVVRICILRHSKSGSNLLRERGKKQESQALSDPGLTVLGRKAATEYSPVLQKILEDNGFDLDTTLVGASPLRRAQETASALFPTTTIQQFDALNEHGHIPENIPRCTTNSRKGWTVFLNWLTKHHPSGSVVAVGHRTFFRREVLRPLGKRAPMNNMDGAILEYDGTTLRFIKHIPYGKTIPMEGDRYIDRYDRYKRKSHTQSSMKHRSRSQNGGGTLPQAYFQDGAQIEARSDIPTGVFASVANWIRPPITQTGGKRATCKCKKQTGGFPPAIMGSFVENGLSLLPAAGYMFYRSRSAKKKTLRRRKTQSRV